MFLETLITYVYNQVYNNVLSNYDFDVHILDVKIHFFLHYFIFIILKIKIKLS